MYSVCSLLFYSIYQLPYQFPETFSYSGEISPLSTTGAAKLSPFSLLLTPLVVSCLYAFIDLAFYGLWDSGCSKPGPPYPLPSHVVTPVSRLRNRLRKALGGSDLCNTPSNKHLSRDRRWPLVKSVQKCGGPRPRPPLLGGPAPSASSFLEGKSEATARRALVKGAAA